MLRMTFHLVKPQTPVSGLFFCCVMLGLSGCAIGNREPHRLLPSQMEEIRKAEQQSLKNEVQTAQAGQARIQQATPTPRPSDIQLTGGEFPAVVSPQHCPPGSIIYTPASPRIPLSDPATMAASAENYPDEYIYDGGDREGPVHYDRFNRLGLDTEDTVGEFTDHLNEHHTKKSNRVAIYAPRFAAVSSTTSPYSGSRVQEVFDTRGNTAGAGIRTQLASNSHGKTTSPTGVNVRTRPSGVDTDYIGAGIRGNHVPSINKVNVEANEGIGFLISGRFNTSEVAWLNNRMQAAAAWSGDLAPYITASDAGAQVFYAEARSGQMTGIEEKVKGKGRLRIVKLADKKVAKPGDVITFTIRYDNLGGTEVFHVKIIDNLTPRLEFIPGSEKYDHAADFVVEDNGEGSSIIKLMLKKPLPGNKGGVLTFKTRVR